MNISHMSFGEHVYADRLDMYTGVESQDVSVCICSGVVNYIRQIFKVVV